MKETPKGIPYLSCREQSATCNPVFVWPKHGITALIKKVLGNLAAQGGPILAVRKISTHFGPRWEVYPLKVRNSLGTFAPQPDFLSATVHIPASTTLPYGVPEVVAKQLTRKWGHKFEWGGCCLFIEGVPPAETKLGRSLTLSARRALLYHLDSRWDMRVLCGLSDAACNINIVQMPYREPLRPPTPATVPARMVLAKPFYPSDWLQFSRTRKGIMDIQGALAKAGHLHTAPTTKWDASAIDAVRQFQAANGLRPSGKFDFWTARKLLPFLPEIPAHLEPAKPGMDPALAYWLGSTPDGRKEIEEALKKAGFYNGAITSTARNPGAEAALKAFPKGNGLRPTGYFDNATAEKLAPFLPKPKE
jgi:peptidoglycan hydrolase-like protein with peptidoglycan-binding domain